ncbi:MULTISPECIES: dihydrofolate reductase family protein [Geobacter]|uniref:dihydrofolate reductase family protein n=1 Tax=Geobacter TaxID=28231 RepID=UPI002574636E|nr:dihydrofolate reductase family protein [Geobacter sulfurreducens]BEH09087.1 dihydrofolate reductase family protein [Geobacter sulfurreducens subsp. ethanolicus]BET56978.1 dihydrofolate reductase family protein [Geobacter sp. 60473]HML77816.1 dihydrofolate reductase family protein [Geobacter sulfurreducens]
MRKIIVLEFVSLDGVIQAPGGPQEDTDGNFKYGGWIVPYFDERSGDIMQEQMSRTRALLLGRKTYEIFAYYWPTHESAWPGINSATKYVVSDTLTASLWDNTVIIKDNVVEEIRSLKQQDGPDLQVYGSSRLLQTLLKHDLADELLLKIFPVTLGTGKRLFGEGTLPAAFTLTHSEATPRGVIVANYERAGEVQTGSF